MVALDHVTLPSGGGCSIGLREQFGADHFKGTGSLSVPLVLPQGRTGFQPELALIYSSDQGNGLFGLGSTSRKLGAPHKAAEIHSKTGYLSAVQLLPGHSKIDSAVRYLGVELEDALSIAERIDV